MKKDKDFYKRFRKNNVPADWAKAKQNAKKDIGSYNVDTATQGKKDFEYYDKVDNASKDAKHKASKGLRKKVPLDVDSAGNIQASAPATDGAAGGSISRPSIPDRSPASSIDPESARQLEMLKGNAIVAHSPEDFNQVITDQVDSGDLPESVGKEFQDKANKGIDITTGNEGSPLKQAFAEGIAAFLPTIVGAAFGRAQEGAAITKSLNDTYGSEKGSGLDQFQQSTDILTKEGKVARWNKTQGRYESLDGTKLGPNDAVNTIQGRFERREVQKAIRRKDDIRKQFKKDKIVQGLEDAMSNANKATALLNSGSPMAAGLTPRALAKLSGEVGRLTEEDVAAFKNPNIKSQIIDAIKLGTGNSLGADTKRVFLEALGILVTENKRQMQVRAKNFSRGFSQEATKLNLTEDEIFNSLIPSAKKKYTREDFSKMTDDELDAFYEARKQ